MNLGALTTALAANVRANIADPGWTVHRFLPRGREGWDAPAITFDNWVLPQVGSTLGLTLVTCRLIAVASETDVADVGDALYGWLSTESGGKLAQLGELTDPAWNEIDTTGAQIDDDLKIGQQSYRAALIGLSLLCP